METMPTTRLGKYYLLSHLAHGGMSDIYLARTDDNNQFYCIKLVKEDFTDNYQHFRRESFILGNLKHEHILPLIDYHDDEDGIAYYVTPYIEQGSLRELLNEGPLSQEEAWPILSQVGEALQFIHDLGLVHRDIKPANILLGQAHHVWLADFGLAKDANTSGDLTDSNCLFGTPHYLAPELLKEPASQSSDIYALGVVLYEMLTGRVPFTGPTLLAIYWKHVDEVPPLPSLLNPHISEAIEQVILRALAKRPEERFASAREMAEAYQEALLAPTSRFQPAALALEAPEPMIAGKMIVQAPLSGLHTPEFAQLRQRRLLAVCMTMLVLLFVLSVSILAVTFQSQTPAPASASAQMIALPAHPPATHAPVPSPTAKPSATPTPQNSNRVQSQGNSSHKHHKHKGNGGDD